MFCEKSTLIRKLWKLCKSLELKPSLSCSATRPSNNNDLTVDDTQNPKIRSKYISNTLTEFIK